MGTIDLHHILLFSPSPSDISSEVWISRITKTHFHSTQVQVALEDHDFTWSDSRESQAVFTMGHGSSKTTATDGAYGCWNWDRVDFES